MGCFRPLVLFAQLIYNLIAELTWFLGIFLWMIICFTIPYMLLARGIARPENCSEDVGNWINEPLCEGDSDYFANRVFTNLDGETWFKPVLVLYMGALGEFGFMDNFDRQESIYANRLVSWSLFFLLTFFLQIIMLNLIIGIVCDVFAKSQEREMATLYGRRTVLTLENLHLVRFSTRVKLTTRGRYLLTIREQAYKQEPSGSFNLESWDL
jgi:hypothetical protein